MVRYRRRVPATAEAMLRTAIRHRLSGHAAEIAFYALLTLIPATATVGGVLHLLAHVLGPETVPRGADGATQSIRLLIGPKLADSVVGPFVRAQLNQREGGPAIGGVLVSWWLFSRLFYAVGHALDVAYGVSDHRPSRMQRLHALFHAAAAVIAVSLVLAAMALTWRTGSSRVGRWFALAPSAGMLWSVLRWPVLFAILVGVLSLLYRYSPNTSHSVRQCLPGAVAAVLIAVAVGTGFRAYLLVGGGAPTGVSSDDAHVQLIGRAVGASVATALFMYVIALVVLIGAEINAAIERGSISLRPRPAAVG